VHDVQNKFSGCSDRHRLPQRHRPQPGMATEQVLHTRRFSIFPAPYCPAGQESMHDLLSKARYLLSPHIVHTDPLLHARQLAMTEHSLHTRPTTSVPSPYWPAAQDAGEDTVHGQDAVHDPLSSERYLLSPHVVHTDPLLHALQPGMSVHGLHSRPSTTVPSPLYDPPSQNELHDPLSNARYLLSPHVVHTDPLLHAVQPGMSVHGLHSRPSAPVPSPLPYCPAGQDDTHHPVSERYLLSPHVSHRSALLHAMQLPVPSAPLHDLHSPPRPSASTPSPYDPAGQDEMQEPLFRARNLLFSHIVQLDKLVHALQSALHAAQKPPFAENAPYCPAAVGQLSKQAFLSILRNLPCRHWVHSPNAPRAQAMQSEHGFAAEHWVHFVHTRPKTVVSAGSVLSSPKCMAGHSSTHVADQPTGKVDGNVIWAPTRNLYLLFLHLVQKFGIGLHDSQSAVQGLHWRTLAPVPPLVPVAMNPSTGHTVIHFWFDKKAKPSHSKHWRLLLHDLQLAPHAAHVGAFGELSFLYSPVGAHVAHRLSVSPQQYLSASSWGVTMCSVGLHLWNSGLLGS
jgi:hypothetical protein